MASMYGALALARPHEHYPLNRSHMTGEETELEHGYFIFLFPRMEGCHLGKMKRNCQGLLKNGQAPSHPKSKLRIKIAG